MIERLVRPLIIIWPHALIFWMAFVWSFYPESKLVRSARLEAKKEGSKDAGSVQLLMGSMWIAFVISLLVALTVRATTFSGSRLAAFYAGVSILILGSVLRRFCWRALGEHFTGDVKARVGQPVIQRGPYSWVRHPSYTAAMMMYGGIGLALTNWLSLGILIAAGIVAYGYRVRVEERALLATIGEPYAEYTRTRKRFVPFLF